jgi:hypothetical protein
MVAKEHEKIFKEFVLRAHEENLYKAQISFANFKRDQ